MDTLNQTNDQSDFNVRVDALVVPQRIQRKRAAGWKMTKNTIYVGRPTKWGNPFVVGKNGDVKECVRKYELWIKRLAYDYRNAPNPDELRGKNLACWCKCGEPCHADILLEIANR